MYIVQILWQNGKKGTFWKLLTCTELDEEILMDKEYRRKIATGEAGRSARGVRPELPEQPLSLGKVL